MAVLGDKVNYPEDIGMPTADLLLVKTHLNSVISTPKAKYLTLDISNFYLNTPMVRSEYARIHIDNIPEEVIEEYNLRDKEVDVYVYIEIVKGMYGLPQAGILAQELLEKQLVECGYTQSKIIHGLWKHSSRPTTFTLVVDDFGVKYISMEDANHLIDVLQKYYQITIDWMDQNTQDSLWIGIMTNDACTYRCRAIPRKRWRNFSIQSKSVPKIPRTLTQ